MCGQTTYYYNQADHPSRVLPVCGNALELVFKDRRDRAKRPRSDIVGCAFVSKNATASRLTLWSVLREIGDNFCCWSARSPAIMWVLRTVSRDVLRSLHAWRTDMWKIMVKKREPPHFLEANGRQCTTKRDFTNCLDSSLGLAGPEPCGELSSLCGAGPNIYM